VVLRGTTRSFNHVVGGPRDGLAVAVARVRRTAWQAFPRLFR
jgi:hypothetical protein